MNLYTIVIPQQGTSSENEAAIVTATNELPDGYVVEKIYRPVASSVYDASRAQGSVDFRDTVAVIIARQD